MKKFLVFLAAISLVFGVVGTASAVPFEYSDWYVDLELIENGESLTWQHNINDGGFNPATDTISTVTIDLGLSDDLCPLLDPLDIEWGGWRLGFIAGNFETAELFADGINYDVGEIDFGAYTINLAAWLQLQDTGLLDVTLTGTGGDFYFGFSHLEATGDTAPVPEPATMLLLGSGLIGLVGLGRKKFFKRG
jgi:hypothetical protein